MGKSGGTRCGLCEGLFPGTEPEWPVTNSGGARGRGKG